MSDSDDEQDPVPYTFPGVELSISTAENEFNKGKKTLFATYVWSGSIVLCNIMANKLQDFIKNKTFVEFGAAAGTPSILAAKMGARFVVATDYPSKSVIRNLRRNIERNDVGGNTRALEYIWGEDYSLLLEANNGEQFDVAMATECLWRHESHHVLIESVISLLKPGGTLLLTYSHHVPGFEAQDDEFLVIAQSMGLSIDITEEIVAPHMWSDEKMSTIYFVQFTKQS